MTEDLPIHLNIVYQNYQITVRNNCTIEHDCRWLIDRDPLVTQLHVEVSDSTIRIRNVLDSYSLNLLDQFFFFLFQTFPNQFREM